MNVLRRFVVAICASVFFFAAIGLAWSHVANNSLRDRQKVKESLNQGSIYDGVADVIAASLSDSANSGDTAGEVPLDDPLLQEKMRAILTPDFLRDSTEQIIDGVYNWLEGKADQPDFRIDLSEFRTQLAAELGNYAAERAASLPTCTSIPTQYDALTADCVPPTITTTQIKEAVEQEFLNTDGFFNDPVITAEDFTDPNTQQPIFSNIENFRKMYQAGYYLPYVLALITIISGAVILSLSSSRRSGALRLGIISTIVTTILGLSYVALYRGPELLRNSVVGEPGTTANPAGEELALNVFETFASNSGKLIGLYALLFTVVAIACFVAYASMGKSDKKDDDAGSTEPKPPIDDSAPSETAPVATQEPRPEPKKPRTPRKIQL